MSTAARKKIGVLVVDDSLFYRKFISDVLKSDSNIEVLDTAKNGKECLEKAMALKPDIITLDIEMPVLNGLEVLPELMKLKPVPKVIMLSALTRRGSESTIKALELGALEFVTKPEATQFNFSAESLKKELIQKTIALGRSLISYSPQPQELKSTVIKDADVISDSSREKNLKYIIAIGTSTGGPRALQEVLTKMPGNLPAAVLVVQHMPPGFTKSLAERLDSICGIRVKEAQEGDILKPGWTYIAPGDYHMVVSGKDEGYRISINKEPPVGGHRPSVDVMMKSVAECGHRNIIGVIMTGMGSDGSDGILKIKKAGGMTIAQDESTCIVFGMPKSALKKGAIDTVAPLYNITAEILKYMGV